MKATTARNLILMCFAPPPSFQVKWPSWELERGRLAIKNDGRGHWVMWGDDSRRFANYNVGDPCGLVGGPCACQDQFRRFESHRVHARRAFSCIKIDELKARERELATFDAISTSRGNAEPYARQEMKARTGGEKGRYL